MSSFKKDKRSGGGRSFGGGGKSFGNRPSGGRDFGGQSRGGDRERPQMHDAVCDECGNRCQVPFRPTGDKPVYCSDCFGGRGGDDRGGRREERSFGRDRNDRSFGGNKERQMFGATCSSCGSRCEVPFRPTGEKPVYCDDCFGKNKSGGVAPSRDQGGNKGGGDIKEQLNLLNTKLDKLLKLFGEDVGGGQLNNKTSKKSAQGGPAQGWEKKSKSENDLDISEIEDMVKEAKEMEVMGKKIETEPVETQNLASKKKESKKPAAKKPAAKKAPAKKKK